MTLRAKYTVAFALLVLLPALSANAASEKDEDLAEIGDWVQILLPISGYAGAWISGDKEGAYQLTKALLGAGASAQVFKAAASRVRPDATDERSFPSGHTTAAYSGAEFIRIRYGNGWGIPAHIGAAFVGYSRIRANKHFRDDVLAGAANGLLWNWFFTSPHDEALKVRPARLDDGYMIEIQYDFDKQIRVDPDFSDSPRFEFTLEYGPVSQEKNLFASPADTGFEIDLATAENEFDFTSRVMVRHFFRDRHEWEGYLAPMELIEFDPSQTISGPADFAGKTFIPTPDSQFEARYNLLELRFAYRYELLRSDRFSLRVGAGLQYKQTFLGITQFRGRPAENDIIEMAEAKSEDVNAIFSGRAKYKINPRWDIQLEIDGYDGSDSYLNTALSVNWHAAPGWKLGLGGRWIEQEIRNSNLRNELQVGDLVFRVAHDFF